jgi:hypothetical protein
VNQPNRMPEMRRSHSIDSGWGKWLCFLPLLVGSPVVSQVRPCSDWACDSMVVRTILDANGVDQTVYNATQRVGRVTRLFLRGLGLTSLPAAIGRLDSLQYLDLGENRLTDLPPEIGELRALTGLLLSHNRRPMGSICKNWWSPEALIGKPACGWARTGRSTAAFPGRTRSCRRIAGYSVHGCERRSAPRR